MALQKSSPAATFIAALGPFAVLTFIYFVVGFFTTVNGQFQGPLKVAFLSQTVALRNTLTTLISFSFFLGYLLNGQRGGKWINAVGYKSTLLRALGIMVGGLLLYALSSWVASRYADAHLWIGDDAIPYGYFVFLLGSFLMGTSAAILQVVINPYVAAYDLPGTQPVQRMNIVCAINSLGTTLAPFFVTAVIFAGEPLEGVTAGQLRYPFVLLALCIGLTIFVTSKMRLPDLAHTHATEGGRLKRSVWSFSHLRNGVIAIFFYVGAEVSIGVNINLHAMEQTAGGAAIDPALLATLYWGALMVGRIFFSFFPNLSPRYLLIGTTTVACALLLFGICANNLWALAAVGLCHSVMWSCIFTLAIKGLGEYTSSASGVFMMGVFGGAVFPVLQGLLADVFGAWQYTWLLALACEGVMLWYALRGSRVTDAFCLQTAHESHPND